MATLVQRDNTVTVYSYRVFNLEACEMELACGKATREAIGALARAELLACTAEEVAPAALNPDGHFRRQATGWGDLSA